MSAATLDVRRPYLVIPKLVAQPSWGGEWIAETKGWSDQASLAGVKVGQSYELFSGSNLSLEASSLDPAFQGELTDSYSVETATRPVGSVSLASLVELSPDDVLGSDIAANSGGVINVLIKLTQAMGNSFQVHIKDGIEHPFWQPKPESWYYLEPGLITLGAAPDVDWRAYQEALTALNNQIEMLAAQVKSGAMSYEAAQPRISELVEKYNPWAFVNTVRIGKNQLIDLSGGGLHHSWEEDSARFPLGNVLYEVQLQAMDRNSTLRAFDKGKMSKNGTIRALNIDDYFELIDRHPEANRPETHMAEPKALESGEAHDLAALLDTKYYRLNRLTLKRPGAGYTEKAGVYRHLFIQEGSAEISTNGGSLVLTRGHSCFVPASAGEYSVNSTSDKTVVLITT